MRVSHTEFSKELTDLLNKYHITLNSTKEGILIQSCNHKVIAGIAQSLSVGQGFDEMLFFADVMEK